MWAGCKRCQGTRRSREDLPSAMEATVLFEGSRQLSGRPEYHSRGHLYRQLWCTVVQPHEAKHADELSRAVSNRHAWIAEGNAARRYASRIGIMQIHYSIHHLPNTSSTICSNDWPSKAGGDHFHFLSTSECIEKLESWKVNNFGGAAFVHIGTT